MNIAFDSTAILGPMSRNRGIGNYSFSQFTKMLEMDKDNQYFFLNVFDEEFTFTGHDNIQQTFIWCGKERFISMNPDYKNIYAGFIQNFIKNNKIDVFYITSPFDGNIFPYERAWFGNARVVATVYDIIPYVMRDVYLTDKNTQQWYMRCFESFKHFDKYLVISESVKSDLINHANISGDKIKVMHGAASEMFCRIDVPEDKKMLLYDKFGITGNFIMSTSGDDYRKNIKELILAYKKLPKSLTEIYQLAIVCKLSPVSEEHYTKIINDCGLQGRVLLTGYVTDDELLYLYNLASLMAFPSKYEGFGLPVVEAFSCGTPVLTSNNSSLGEIAKDAAVLVDPFDIDDIARGLKYALTEADAPAMIEKGYQRVELYQWNNVAAIALDTLNELKSDNSSKTTTKNKIAFFSPLPPLESGISDYAVDIIHALNEYYDIHVYIDDGYTPTCRLPNNVSVYNHKQYKKNANTYFDTMHQVGNSLFHTYMFPYIQNYKGTVVLHDLNLHLVARAHTIHIIKNQNEYARILQEDYTPDQVNEIITVMLNPETSNSDKDELANKCLVNGFVTNYATKLIVHSHESRKKLLQKNIGRCVRTIPSYAKIMPLITSDETKINHGYKTDDIVISSFGHIHETKRIMPALHAFYQLTKSFDNVYYIFVGKPDPSIAEEFNQFIQVNNLMDKVRVTGYVDINVFDAYIDVIDICLNLRHPYNGETSATLMRVLAKGKCIIVNNVGSFGEIPDECCVKLPNVEDLSLSDEINCIYDALQLLINDPGRRGQLAAYARHYAEIHLDINTIAKQFYAFMNESPFVALDEKILEIMKHHELYPKGYTEKEMQLISKSLTYAIAPSSTHIQLKPDPYKHVLMSHKLQYKTNESPLATSPLRSSLARRQDLIALKNWAVQFPDSDLSNYTFYSRKNWEWIFITQALFERGMLSSGKRGIGFAVGCEPLPALFASHGVHILATDMSESLLETSESNWSGTNQHTTGTASLRYPDICDPETFDKNVRFMPVDMNHIPSTLSGFDFCWSSCALEHIGGIQPALAFIFNALQLLKPGGIAVHTTEYNISESESVNDPRNAVFGAAFFNELVTNLEIQGHYMEPLDFRLGNHPDDDYIYAFEGTNPHFKLLLYNTVATSIGIIIKKSCDVTKDDKITIKSFKQLDEYTQKIKDSDFSGMTHAEFMNKHVLDFDTFTRLFGSHPESDPFSDKYRNWELDFFSFLSGDKYDISNEGFTFDAAELLEKPPASGFTTEQTVFYMKGYADFLDIIRPEKGSRVLEMGFGFGNLLELMGRCGCTVYGVDISNDFVNYTKKRLSAQGISSNLLCGTFMDIASFDVAFDLVVFESSFHHCNNPIDVLNMLHKKMVKNGKIVFIHDVIHPHFDRPWGIVRYDGIALNAIRQHKWLELGYRTDFFEELLSRTGFQLKKTHNLCNGDKLIEVLRQ